MSSLDNESRKSFTKVVREGTEKACRDFSIRIEALGFQRTLKMAWTRQHPFTVDVVHFHRHGSTFGAPITASVDFRVELSIRVLSDDFTAISGPISDPGTLRAGRYHLRFNAETGSTYDRCLDDLVRFVREQGEPWFEKWRSVDTLLESSESPLPPREKELLRAARNGQADAEKLAASLQRLGIPKAPQMKCPDRKAIPLSLGANDRVIHDAESKLGSHFLRRFVIFTGCAMGLRCRPTGRCIPCLIHPIRGRAPTTSSMRTLRAGGRICRGNIFAWRRTAREINWFSKSQARQWSREFTSGITRQTRFADGQMIWKT